MHTSSSTSPADSSMTAAHHCLAAENFFARAKEIHEKIENCVGKPGRFQRRFAAELKELYKTYMEWARFHLQMAEVMTLGSGLVIAHSHAASTVDMRFLSRDVAREAAAWDAFVAGEPHDGRERWLPKPDASDAEY